MESVKHLINFLSSPNVIFPTMMLGFFFVFPINDWFANWNKRLGIYKVWTNTGGLIIHGIVIAFFVFGLTDENFRKIVLKPDNVPISGLILATVFFLWLSMKQAYENDARLAAGEKPTQIHDPNEKVIVWPDLVFIEMMAMIIGTAFLIVWGIGLDAPIEEPANPSDSPNPSKAPWYFLGLQEMLVYFDPWIAGVVLPTIMIVGLMAIPYLDNNKEGVGYFSFKQRRMAISIFLFGWLLLWLFLIIVGTFMRGPNWNFFGPFEFWDPHKLEVLNNINLSEFIWVLGLEKGLPSNILIREFPGFLLVAFYFFILPPLLAKTVFRKLHENLGNFRFSVFVMLLLLGGSLPLKMYLRWLFNLKYLIAIPEFFFNI